MSRVIRAGRAAAAGRTSPLAVAAELDAAGVRPRKSRGQNFLVQPAIADRIVAAAALAPGDEVVEIGPGLGILSDKILRAGVRRLWLVELDVRLASRLESAFMGHPAVRVVCRDFLDVDLGKLVERPPVKVIGNLPFNAAAAILRRLDEMRGPIGRMVLMFQREVAERIRARGGEPAYSALSVFTALYWETREHFRVAAGNFRPTPRVDAEVIVFTPHQPEPFAPADEAALLATIRAAFSAPRKTIRNALAGALGAAPEAVAAALARAAIDTTVRPATLSVTDFLRLASALERTGAIAAAPAESAMPELPEVESLRRILARSTVGRTIERARIAEPRLRRKVAHDLAARVEGRRIVRLGRRAKYLIIELSDGAAMIVHLGMSGSLTHHDFDDGEFAARHDHVEFALDDRTRLVYNDPRRFGLIRLVSREELPSAPELADLGPEPLSAAFNAEYLARMARGRRAAIKNLIMDQRIVAGIGNIYASEILFRAGVRPTRRAAKVTRKEIERIVAETAPVLRAAIGSRGTTFRSYRDSEGQPGRFAPRLMVYGREGEPCRVCKSAIRNVIVGQRASFFCPHCQR